MHGGDRWRFPPKKSVKEWDKLVEIMKKRNSYWKAKVEEHLWQKGK
jgi:hypothetical protein